MVLLTTIYDQLFLSTQVLLQILLYLSPPSFTMSSSSRVMNIISIHTHTRSTESFVSSSQVFGRVETRAKMSCDEQAGLNNGDPKMTTESCASRVDA